MTSNDLYGQNLKSQLTKKMKFSNIFNFFKYTVSSCGSEYSKYGKKSKKFEILNLESVKDKIEISEEEFYEKFGQGSKN